jgi:hypothetical protein
VLIKITKSHKKMIKNWVNLNGKGRIQLNEHSKLEKVKKNVEGIGFLMSGRGGERPTHLPPEAFSEMKFINRGGSKS